MKNHGKTLVFRQDFLEELENIKSYLEQFGQTAIKNFLKEFNYIINDRIPNYPESYPEFHLKRTPQKIYRRALFKKKYYIIYKLGTKEIEFIFIYHSSRNIENMGINI